MEKHGICHNYTEVCDKQAMVAAALLDPVDRESQFETETGSAWLANWNSRHPYVGKAMRETYGGVQSL